MAVLHVTSLTEYLVFLQEKILYPFQVNLALELDEHSLPDLETLYRLVLAKEIEASDVEVLKETIKTRMCCSSTDGGGGIIEALEQATKQEVLDGLDVNKYINPKLMLELLQTKVDKVAGKQLSELNFTQAHADKIGQFAPVSFIEGNMMKITGTFPNFTFAIKMPEYTEHVLAPLTTPYTGDRMAMAKAQYLLGEPDKWVKIGTDVYFPAYLRTRFAAEEGGG